jgi:hypothetical protein
MSNESNINCVRCKKEIVGVAVVYKNFYNDYDRIFMHPDCFLEHLVGSIEFDDLGNELEAEFDNPRTYTKKYVLCYNRSPLVWV